MLRVDFSRRDCVDSRGIEETKPLVVDGGGFDRAALPGVLIGDFAPSCGARKVAFYFYREYAHIIATSTTLHSRNTFSIYKDKNLRGIGVVECLRGG